MQILYFNFYDFVLQNYYIEFFCRIVSLVLKLYLLFFKIFNSSKLPLSPTLMIFGPNQKRANFLAPIRLFVYM